MLYGARKEFHVATRAFDGWENEVHILLRHAMHAATLIEPGGLSAPPITERRVAVIDPATAAPCRDYFRVAGFRFKHGLDVIASVDRGNCIAACCSHRSRRGHWPLRLFQPPLRREIVALCARVTGVRTGCTGSGGAFDRDRLASFRHFFWRPPAGCPVSRSALVPARDGDRRRRSEKRLTTAATRAAGCPGRVAPDSARASIIDAVSLRSRAPRAK